MTNLNDTGAGSLRAVIALSGNGDSIGFSVTGTINLTSGELAISHNISINGPGSPFLTVGRSSAGGTPDFRVFNISNGTASGPIVTIAGIYIINGKASGTGASGGGIFNDHGTLTLTNCTLSGNVAEYGGGIHNNGANTSANLTVTGCTLANNTAVKAGGAIYNSGVSGGAGSLTVTNSTLIANFANLLGGAAIYNTGGNGNANCTVLGSTFNLNDGVASGNGNGGAIYNEGGSTSSSGGNADVHIAESTLNGNSATNGGAIYNIDWNENSLNDNSASVTVTNCTLSGNSAANNGGAASNVGTRTGGGSATAHITFVSCTLNQNVGVNGIFNLSNTNSSTFVTVSLGNTILLKASGGVVNIASGGIGANVVSLGYNLCSDNGHGFLTGTGDQINTDPKLDPQGLQSNGGPTQTIALTAGSPAIDKGYSFSVGVDQREQVRPVDNPAIPNAPGGDGSDIGAYEAPLDPIQGGVPSFIVTTTDDHNDGVCSGADCTLREALQKTDSVSGPGTITFAGNVTGTITLQLGMGALSMSDDTIISGPGARVLALSGNENHRVFIFNAGSSTVSGLTIRDGWATGGAVGASNIGGGIYNQATVTLDDCAFTHNSALGVSGSGGSGGDGGSGQGGGVYNAGTLTLNRCTFYRSTSGNVAGGGNGGANTSQFSRGGAGGVGQGGAIFNAASATLLVNNSTFNGNSAAGGSGGTGTQFGGNGGAGSGGAICNQGTMTLSACTLSANVGVSGVGAHGGISNGFTPSSSGCLAALSGSSNLKNTISAGNAGNFGGGDDVAGTFISSGYNLIGNGDFSTGFNASGDQVGTTAAPIDPKLGSLQNNGGFTDTMALLTNSPAIDQGKSFSLTTDERGHERPFDAANISNASGGDGSDIGAFELGGTLVPMAAVSRKVHGAAGTFDIALPLTGPMGVECRTGGATGDFQVVLIFAAPVSVTGSPQAQVTSGNGQIGSGGTSNGGIVTVNGAVVIVPLTNVANAQKVTLALFSASDGANTNDVSVPIGFLLGDTSGNGIVNSSDVSQTKSKSGQVVDATNFREDVTVNGVVNSSDVSTVKLKSGTALPP